MKVRARYVRRWSSALGHLIAVYLYRAYFVNTIFSPRFPVPVSLTTAYLPVKKTVLAGPGKSGVVMDKLAHWPRQNCTCFLPLVGKGKTLSAHRESDVSKPARWGRLFMNLTYCSVEDDVSDSDSSRSDSGTVGSAVTSST